MKTIFCLTMEDTRTGTEATCFVEAEVFWIPTQPQNVDKMADFRPLRLRDLQIGADRRVTRYVPYPPPGLTVLQRLRRWLAGATESWSES